MDVESLDWFSHKVLGWHLSNTLDTGGCLAALEMAIATAGRVPDIINTDQGRQFTSEEWTKRLIDLGVKISMDGKGRCMDNVVVKRFWRSLKHEDAYLRCYETVPDLIPNPWPGCVHRTLQRLAATPGTRRNNARHSLQWKDRQRRIIHAAPPGGGMDGKNTSKRPCKMPQE
jgi:transposase InsO family protein